MKIHFPKNRTIEQHRDLANKVYLTASQSPLDKEFVVEFKSGGDLEKTYKQIKGVHKLLELSLPHFQRWKPQVDWDLKKVKVFAKLEMKYLREPTNFEIALMIKSTGFEPETKEEKKKMAKFCKQYKQVKSFADATKSELMEFVGEYEKWAQTPIYEMIDGVRVETKPAWLDVFLTNEEKEAYFAGLEKQINNKNK
jgi:hypothetical protein